MSAKPAQGVLFVVAMPIGNRGDLSPRAVETLARADLIACEDTRRLAPLLHSLGIRAPTLSCFEHNEVRRAPEILARLREGATVVLVSDAGTPTISDPGYRLVRAAWEAGIRVSTVPGPCAAIAALSVAGLPTDRFAFEGFLPARASARRKALAELRGETRTMVFFEAGRRLVATLSDMLDAFGPDRIVAVMREATKTFEETARGNLKETLELWRQRPALGEVTLVVDGAAPSDTARTTPAPVLPAVTVEMLREAGLSLKQASAVIAKLGGGRRREIYQKALGERRAGPGPESAPDG